MSPVAIAFSILCTEAVLYANDRSTEAQLAAAALAYAVAVQEELA